MPRKKKVIKRSSPTKLAKTKSALKNITNDGNKGADKMIESEAEASKDLAQVDCLKDLKRKSDKSADVSPRKKLVTEEPSSSSDPAVARLTKKYQCLQRSISKKYVNVAERLKLDYVPLCAKDIEHCHTKHYKNAAPPASISTSQVNLLRNAVQQSRFEIFISLLRSCCQTEEFPGENVLTDIVQMILTLNPEGKHNSYLEPILSKLFVLFSTILRVFPPCWLSLRPAYVRFLQSTIDVSKLMPEKAKGAQYTVFELALMLLEDTIEEPHTSRGARSAKPKRNAAKDLKCDFESMEQWEKLDTAKQSFSALPKATKLSRLMQVLDLIARLLETDLAMWMLRYHTHPQKYLFSGSDQPLVISLFSLSLYQRTSLEVKRVTTLFAMCAEKNLDDNCLAVMGRFISLLANIQNLSEIEGIPSGIRYPQVGPAAASFTVDLFKQATAHLKTDFNAFMRLIKAIRCSFVRYEFIDLFLNRMNSSPGKMCPQKIVENFRKNRWLECVPDEERSSSKNKRSVVYRGDYLTLLLDALKSYCEFHGTKEFLQEVQLSVKGETKVEADSLEPAPSSGEIDLAAMSNNIADLEEKWDGSKKMREPRPVIPIVNILVDSAMYLQYRNDLKYVLIMQAFIPALQQVHEEDFSAMMDFLNDFAPRT